MSDPFEMFGMFRPDPKVDARILNSVMPSDFIPKAGDYFRVRSATIADRSYMGDIWLCLEFQDHCAAGRKVMDTYGGLTSKSVGEVRSFVAGDVIFYDCSKLWASIEEDRSPPAHGGES